MGIASIFFNLMEEAHDPANPKYGYKSFSMAMGVPHRTFMRWKKKIEIGDDKNVPVTVDMVIGLATMSGTTCREIMTRLVV